jgi:guanosine-3',5'-bis(diphosphate) 3'-pyrophosphohydrolase
VQTIYQETISYAAEKHGETGQKVKGSDLPYVVHLSNVAMELFMADKNTKQFDLLFAIRVALLHDVIEDTSATFEEVSERYGKEVAEAVRALTKDEALPKEEQIADSLRRIRREPKEVWAVKLADRITNLQPAPADWSKQRRKDYVKDSRLILEELKGGNPYLEARLAEKIEEYNNQVKEFLLDG